MLVAFHNPNMRDMKNGIDNFLSGFDVGEVDRIVRVLKNVKYGNLELMMRYPYTYELVTP